MTDFMAFIPSIVASLQQVNPYKIYLFGSVASGNTTNDSDVDLAIILDTDKVHQTYDDKIKTRVRVRKSIFDVSCQIPIDILVYSRPEYQKLKEVNPGFVREIEEKGKVIYEKHCS
jgi:predicted nucleotidyltransferase